MIDERYKRIAVLKGGPSAEREVSLRSGAAVARGLIDAGYDVVEVDVVGHDVILPSGIDAVFIALHGEFGEDGQVQDVLDGMGIPYVGSGAESSRIAFDKVLTKKRLIESGIPTPEYQVIAKGQARTLELPVVVKPSRQGSSIGLHKVVSELEWDAAVADAFQYDSELVVEKFVTGRELTVGIVGAQVLPVIEIEAPDHWYDYKAKYTSGMCRYIVPAEISGEIEEKCREEAWRTFQALGCRGFGRVDFLADDKGDVYVLELNNIPGFTETSLLPKAAAHAGMSFSMLCDAIVNTI